MSLSQSLSSTAMAVSVLNPETTVTFNCDILMARNHINRFIDSQIVKTHLIETVDAIEKLVKRVQGYLPHLGQFKASIINLLNKIYSDTNPELFPVQLKLVNYKKDIDSAADILKPIQDECARLLGILNQANFQIRMQEVSIAENRNRELEKLLDEEAKSLFSGPRASIFNSLLVEIGKHLKTSASPPNGCYIAYGYPLDENHDREHFIHDFLSILKSHLETAGITKVHLDKESNPDTGSVHGFMQNIAVDDYLIVIGTKSAFDKQRTTGGSAAICTEISLAKRKMADDDKLGKRRTTLVLLTHDIRQSFPPEFQGHQVIKEWQQMGYFEGMKSLIFSLYGIDKQDYYRDYNAQWEKIEKKEDNDGVLAKFNEEYKIKRAAICEKARENKSELEEKHFLGKKKESREIWNDNRVTPMKTWRLPANNEYLFVGRQDELKALDEYFSNRAISQPVVLHALSGLGGVGKTQLAIYHAHHARQNYQHCYWFQAENKNSLLQDYRDFLEYYNVPFEHNATESVIIAKVKQYLETHPNWLAIFDNASGPSEINDFIPQHGGHVLITTRMRDWQVLGQSIEIDVFTEKDAITYFKRVLNRQNIDVSEENAIKELIKELGYLPLALAQASAFIKKRSRSVVAYLKDYRDNSLAMLANKIELFGSTHLKPVMITWQISMHAIIEDEKEAKDQALSIPLLEAISFLYSEHIPVTVLIYWVRVHYHLSASVAKNAIDSAVSHLLDYSMIRLDPQMNTINVHRLVQEVVRPSLLPGGEFGDLQPLLKAIATAVNNEFHTQINLVEDEIRQRKLFLHLQALQKHYEKLPSDRDVDLEILAMLYLCCTSVLLKQGDTVQSKKMLTRAREILTKTRDERDADLAEVLYGLGTVHMREENHENASILLNQALNMCEQVYGKNHEKCARILLNLGALYTRIDPIKTQDYIARSMSIFSHSQNSAIPKAMGLMNQAGMNINLGNFAVAKQQSQEALSILKAQYGEDHKEVTAALTNLATAHLGLKNMDEAKRLYLQALPKAERQYDDEHPVVAKILYSLGGIYTSLKEFTTGFAVLERALAIFEKNYQPDYHEIGATVHNLAMSYFFQENYGMSFVLAQRALIIHLICNQFINCTEALSQSQSLLSILLNQRSALQLTAINPHTQKTLYLLLDLLQKEKWQIVCKYFTACQINFNDLGVHIDLREAYCGQKNVLGAICHQEIFLHLMQDNADDLAEKAGFHRDLAKWYHCYAIEQKLDKDKREAMSNAERHFAISLNFDPRADIRTLYANFHLQNENTAQALEYLAQVLDDEKQDGSSDQIVFTPIEANTLDVKLQEELAFWKQITINSVVLARYLRIISYYKQHNISAAKNEISMLQNIAEELRDPVVFSLLGYTQELVGEDEEATISYGLALSLNPSYSLVAQKLEQLSQPKLSPNQNINVSVGQVAPRTNSPIYSRVALEVKEISVEQKQSQGLILKK